LTPHASKLGSIFENRGWRIEILEPNNFEPGGRSTRMLRLFSADTQGEETDLINLIGITHEY
jgi:hypothetical protein